MNYDETSDLLARSLQQRTGRINAEARPDDLFSRAEERNDRRRRIMVVAVIGTLTLGLSGGYVLGHETSDTTTQVSVAPLDDGRPSAGTPDAALLPADVPAAISQIGAAFHAAFDATTTSAARAAATQHGDDLAELWADTTRNAQRLGFTPEQLAGTTIFVKDTKFIDDTHAVVRFDLSIPDHGNVLADRAGYAVFVDGSWKVALRTVCDIVSLDGTTRTCPPAPAR